jgi:GT2 family glycosyltransferase
MAGYLLLEKERLPFVSIIIVNYNGKTFLKECLSSIREIVYPKTQYETILVDNQSVDGSIEYVRENFPEVRIIRLDKNYGFVAGNNIGAKHGKGEYIVLLNNDTKVEKNWLIELVRAAKDENVGVCTSKKFVLNNPTLLDGAGGTMNVLGQGWDRGSLERDVGLYEEPVEVTHPSGASFLVKREIIQAYGYLLEPGYFMYYDDPDLGWRTHLLGYKVVYVPKSVILHKRGGTAGTRTSLIHYLFHRNQIITFYKNLEMKNVIKIMPLLFVNLFFTSLSTTMQEKNSSYIRNIPKIIVSLIKYRKVIVEKRRKVQKIRMCSDGIILFSNEIVAPKSMTGYVGIYVSLVNLYLKLVGLSRMQIKAMFAYDNKAERSVWAL